MRFFDHKASKVNSVFHKEMVEILHRIEYFSNFHNSGCVKKFSFFINYLTRKKVDEEKIRTRQRRASVREDPKEARKCKNQNTRKSLPYPKILGWKEGSKLLWLACKKGDINEIKELIEQGAVVNWSPSKRDIGGQTIFSPKKKVFGMKDFGKSCLTVAIENVEDDAVENILIWKGLEPFF